MTFTIDIDTNPLVGITDADVGVKSGNTIAFTVEGTVRVSDELLGAFAGSRLTPQRVTLVDGEGSRVEVPLDDETGLRLEEIDVGVQLPGADADGPEDLAEAAADELSEVADGDGPAPVDPTAPLDALTGRVAFTVEGVVANAPADAVARVDGQARPASITFAVEDPLRGDGGAPGDPLLDLDLLGFRVTVRANGTIVITALDTAAGLGPL